MGTIIRFRQRPEEAEKKSTAILERIRTIYQQKQRATESLPGLLARLIQAGEAEAVLRAVHLWGTGQMEPQEVLAMCDGLAAAAVSGPADSGLTE